MKSSVIKIMIILMALFFCTMAGCSELSSEVGLAPTQADAQGMPSGIPPSPEAEQTPEPSVLSVSEPTPPPTPTPEPYTDIIIGGTGDIMGHIQQIEDAYNAANQEGYSFYHWFEYIKDALSYPDLMIANLEGPIAGPEKGYNGYPLFNFPDEIVPAMMDAGIDVVLNANNHIMDKGIDGIERTIDVLDEAGMLHTGVWNSQEAHDTPLIIDVNGIKVGVVSATYSLNGYAKHIDPEVLEYLVCFIEEEQVKYQIDLCRKNGAEVVVVCPHMGDEFEAFARRGVRECAESYIAMGADIVFAHHPHVLQPVVRHTAIDPDGTTHSGIIFYSLGNFISSMYTVPKEAGAIAYVKIRRDNTTGAISIKDAQYLPTWVMRKKYDMYAFHILPVGQSLDFPETIEALGPNKGTFYKLTGVWENTLAVMGEEAAEPLRYVPER